MRRNQIALYILIQVFLALCLLVLSIGAQAFSPNHALTQTEESGRHELAHETHETDAHGHHGDIDKDAGHQKNHEGGKDQGHNHKEDIPMAYLFYWGILILVMVIILVYFVFRYKSGQLRPMTPLAVFLVFSVLIAYLIEITPVFSGRFDQVTFGFTHGFHERPNLGFLRFVYKFLLGIFLTFFAFLNMDKERFGLELKKEKNAAEAPKGSRRLGSNKNRKQEKNP